MNIDSDPVDDPSVELSAQTPSEPDHCEAAELAEPHSVEQEMEHNPPEIPNLLLLGLVVELGLAALAILISLTGFYSSSQSLLDLDLAKVIVPALVWGGLATLPMLGLLWLIRCVDFGPLRELRRTMDELLVPVFRHCTMLEIAILAVLAGLGEEMFFRWCLQGGLESQISFLNPVLGPAALPWCAAILVGFLFGLCHFINLSYFAVTALIGIYLGGVMILSRTYLAPAISHALFDFVSLWLIVRLGQNAENN